MPGLDLRKGDVSGDGSSGAALAGGTFYMRVRAARVNRDVWSRMAPESYGVEPSSGGGAWRGKGECARGREAPEPQHPRGTQLGGS
jgi:hypothetical protein